MGRLLDQPGYGRFWTADTVSMFGSHVTAVALPALAILVMKATDVEVGVLRAAQWVPYLLFGVLAGALVDRYPRKPILVSTDLARAALLGLVPLLAFFGLLNVALLIGLIAVFGAMSLFYDAAHQSYLPRLVPPDLLTAANARMEQSGAVAQSTGPVLGGTLVAALGAPFALLVDAFSYLVSGLLLMRVGGPEPVTVRADRKLRAELREGLRWVYHHPMLSPMALANHGRFFFGSIISTVFLLFFAHEISAGMSEKEIAFGLGLALALGGLGGVIGAGLAGRVGLRFGVGPTMISMRLLETAGQLLLVLAPIGFTGWAMAGAAQFVAWFALCVSGPNEMGYRQAVTPDRLQARMNATIRSFNWGTIAIGAPLGGILAVHLGYRATLWLAIAGATVVATFLALSKFRHARHGDPILAPLHSSPASR